MKNTSAFLLLPVFTLGIATAAGCATDRMVVVHSPQASEDLGISVTGTGEAQGQPNVARVTLGVRARAVQAQDAMSEVSRHAASIANAVRALGIADKDIRTERASLYEERTARPMPSPMPVPTKGKAAPASAPALPTVHYVANNIIEITVRDLSMVGKVIGAATQAGANEVQNIMLSLDDSRALRTVARERAMADAREQAEQLAQLSGAKLGEPLLIRSHRSGFEGPVMMAKEALSADAGQVPFSPGQITIQEQVEVRFEIVRD